MSTITIKTDVGEVAINPQKLLRYSLPLEWTRQGFTEVDLTLLWSTFARKLSPEQSAELLCKDPANRSALAVYFKRRIAEAEKIIWGSSVTEEQLVRMPQQLLRQMNSVRKR